MLWTSVTAFASEIKMPLTSKHSLSKSSISKAWKHCISESHVSLSKAKCASTWLSSVAVAPFQKPGLTPTMDSQRSRSFIQHHKASSAIVVITQVANPIKTSPGKMILHYSHFTGGSVVNSVRKLHWTTFPSCWKKGLGAQPGTHGMIRISQAA